MIAMLVALLSIPLGTSTHEHVDAIELNHNFDGRGRLIFDQVIFWERTPTTGRFQVRAWCMVDDRDVVNRRPIQTDNGLYECVIVDSDQRLVRRIVSRVYRESWTQNDPERDDRKHHAESLRVSLVKRKRVEHE
jgi:hypothetical protein